MIIFKGSNYNRVGNSEVASAGTLDVSITIMEEEHVCNLVCCCDRLRLNSWQHKQWSQLRKWIHDWEKAYDKDPGEKKVNYELRWTTNATK